MYEMHKHMHERIGKYVDTNLHFAWEHGNWFEFIPFLLPQFLAIRCEFVEQMVDNVRLENFHAQRIGQFLCISFDFNIKC